MNEYVLSEIPISQFLLSYKNSWWMIPLFISLAILFFIYVAYRVLYNRNFLLRRVAEFELKALRAQFEPHFVFNALNSINRFIISNRAEAASGHLINFARLMRLTLNNSREKSISLFNELDTLKLYLELESLRFSQKFVYKIELNMDIDPKEIQIPPMLIQPYVENAIKHGLNFKSQNGKIDIRFNTDINQKFLFCSIEDNGIGRAKAMEIKLRGQITYPSLGMSITSSRMKVLNKLYQTNITVKVTDLVSESEGAAGTKVEVTIPILSKY